MKNVNATGESSVCSQARRDKVRYPNATLASETDGNPAPYLWRTLPVSINDICQARIVGWDCDFLPYCVGKVRCTWVSDFVSVNLHTELSPVAFTFFI
ncbi:hypothetical protein AVEN_246303-1 [Araneus ventricosus]|uniref:Uncharacterized protein n=1 Tax=Araneus ventricosus TaxID=182803 RepID=A0A4Y2HUX1_ARAVE|nr:hypothetical protein AVEN_246303-1 [Araneus ventricosus]